MAHKGRDAFYPFPAGGKLGEHYMYLAHTAGTALSSDKNIMESDPSDKHTLEHPTIP